jgi:tRNA nucleotidyltransferase (CCA-adding enzyme)
MNKNKANVSVERNSPFAVSLQQGRGFLDVPMDIPPFVVAMVERLQGSGHQAYIVGGVIRDISLRRAVTDWDVATDASPEEIKSVFGNIRHFSLKHGTVTLLDSRREYEVTPFRGAKGPGHTIEEDLGRRDFTIDAMAYDLNRAEILDPYGGMEDILRGLVRAVGDPAERIKEDPLRLLRAIRLSCELGFRIEPKTLQTITTMGKRLQSVALERIREELMKILLIQRPSAGFNLMRRTGLLKEVLPELLEGYLKRQHSAYHRYTIYRHIMETIDRVAPDPVLRLAALLHDIAKPRVREKMGGEYRFLGHEGASGQLAREIMERLKFSHEMSRQVTQLVTHHMVQYDSDWSDGAIRRLIRRVGPENMGYLLALRRADILARGMDDEKGDLLSELEQRIDRLKGKPMVIRPHDLAIDGYKVMEFLALSPGPGVGGVLEELVEKVIDHPELNTEKGLLGLLEEMKNK